MRPSRPALDTSSPHEPWAPSFAFISTTSAKRTAHYTQRPAPFLCETALSLIDAAGPNYNQQKGSIHPTNIKPCRAQRPCQHDPAQSILATPEFPTVGPNRVPQRPTEQGLIEQCHPQCFAPPSDHLTRHRVVLPERRGFVQRHRPAPRILPDAITPAMSVTSLKTGLKWRLPQRRELARGGSAGWSIRRIGPASTHRAL